MTRIQLGGLLFSTLVALGLLFVGLDGFGSVSVGLLLAILTQLIDMQVQLRNMEEKAEKGIQRAEGSVLSMLDLNKQLSQDEWLHDRVRAIASTYESLQDTPYAAYRTYAQQEVERCLGMIQDMAQSKRFRFDYWQGHNPSGYSIIELATQSVKVVSMAYARLWKDGYPDDYVKVGQKAINRGVEFTRIFLLTRQQAKDMADELVRQERMGYNLRIGFLDDERIPPSLRKDFLLADDALITSLESYDDNGMPGVSVLSTDQQAVNDGIARFQALMNLTKPLDDDLIGVLTDDKGRR